MLTKERLVLSESFFIIHVFLTALYPQIEEERGSSQQQSQSFHKGTFSRIYK